MAARRRSFVCIALCLASAGCGDAGERAADKGTVATSSAASDIAGDDASLEPASLAQCKACHSFDKDGAARIGPNLWNVHGQPAASKDGFVYSPALSASGLVWTDDALSAFLENPRAVVPGNRMSFPGVKDAEQRAAIVEYMKRRSDGATVP